MTFGWNYLVVFSSAFLGHGVAPACEIEEREVDRDHSSGSLEFLMEFELVFAPFIFCSSSTIPPALPQRRLGRSSA